MRREIGEQPAAVAATLAQVAAPAAALALAVRDRALDRVVLVARGTSDHVAIYARYLLEARCALSASLAAPSLYTTYRPPVDLSRALVLGVSQSGQTPEIVAALEFAAERGALTAALTNEAGSPLADAAEHALVTAAGRGACRSLPRRRSRRRWPRSPSWPGRSVRVTSRPGSLRCRTRSKRRWRCPPTSSSRPLASLLDAEAAVCISRGYAYATALEAALKLKEVAGLWAEGFSAADLRHGPRAAALGLPALVFHAGGPLAGDVDGLERELAAARLAGRLDRAGPRGAGSRRTLRGARPDRADRPSAARRRASGRPARPRSRQPAGPDEGHAHALELVSSVAWRSGVSIETSSELRTCYHCVGGGHRD